MADWDVVVIGGGAAGLSAAAEVAGTGLSCLLLDRMGGGGELMNLGTLHDVAAATTGPDLAADLLNAAMGAGAELGIAEVTGLASENTGWRIATDDATHHARAVIVATGLAAGTLGLDNEADFAGQGLSHCASCDGPLYRDQPVLVAGADRWAIAEARELVGIAAEVTLVGHGDPPTAGQGFAVLHGHVVGLEGASGLEAALVQPASGGPTRRMQVRAVFVQIGRRPGLDFLPDDLARDEDGRLIADETLQCSRPGVFAAGEARSGFPRTLVAAMADGRRAAASVRAILGGR
jgi:thioredoxin reductase (NADPH)